MPDQAVSKAPANDAAYVRGVFPEIDLIKDNDLATRVIDIWCEIWRSSKWERIEDCPKNPLKYSDDVKLVPHIRSVTLSAISMAENIEKMHPATRGKIDVDRLLAGCLLHDVDKLLMYVPKDDGTAGKDRFADLLPHGTYTGYVMLNHGLDMDLVNAVVCHSENATLSVPITFEGLIMKSVDHAESECMYFFDTQDIEPGRRLPKAGH